MYDVSVVNFIPPRLPKWPLFSSDWAVASHFLQVCACFETFGLCRIGGALDKCLNFFGAVFSVLCRSFCTTDSTELLCRILDLLE
jgi:hypothetical protein